MMIQDDLCPLWTGCIVFTWCSPYLLLHPHLRLGPLGGRSRTRSLLCATTATTMFLSRISYLMQLFSFQKKGNSQGLADAQALRFQRHLFFPLVALVLSFFDVRVSICCSNLHVALSGLLPRTRLLEVYVVPMNRKIFRNLPCRYRY